MMNLKLKRTPGIYLVGFMGSGKSTIGRVLAHRLGWSFFDMDHEIEAAEGTTIREIFEARGEQEFRRIETAIIARNVAWIEQGRPSVLALGGGAFAREGNRALVGDRGVSVWLDCPFEIVERRASETAHRPLSLNPEQFAALYEERVEAYRLADIHIPITGDDPDPVVESILMHPLLQ
jgi:shikimate kinase